MLGFLLRKGDQKEEAAELEQRVRGKIGVCGGTGIGRSSRAGMERQREN